MVRDSIFDLKLVVAFGNFDPFHFFIQKELGNDDLRDIQDLRVSFQMSDDRRIVILGGDVKVRFRISPWMAFTSKAPSFERISSKGSDAASRT